MMTLKLKKSVDEVLLRKPKEKKRTIITHVVLVHFGV